MPDDAQPRRVAADRRAPADHPLLDAIAERWSPRAFDPDRPLTEADVLPLLEAARWAASSSNIQPWRFAWALRGDPAFARLLGCLNPGNAAWAHRAGALVLGCAVADKPGGRGPNRHAAHDLGAALAQMAVQAAADGIGMHAMAGFDREAARAAASAPEGVEPYTAVALGWPGDPALLDEDRRAREAAPRVRLPLAEVAPRGGWGGG
ncbi:nitroreductase family protein [Craurococcus roseus]|uniref:Nitroreductase family protein n=1 Tax=Craurococcus roseus TaxID=77585 RepID=A0ABN1G6I6_9PROT